MKNKKNIYVLGFVALIVWGVIAYKIVKRINPKEIERKVSGPTKVFVPQNIEVTEEYELREEYRDPFLGTFSKKVKKPLKRKTKKPEKKVIFPRVNYQGMIGSKQHNESPIFLIKINDQQNLVKLHEVKLGVKLISGNETEVLLEFERKRQSFAIQK